MKKLRRTLASLLAGTILLASVAIAPGTVAGAKVEGIGRLPTMGWNSWNRYQKDISEAKIKAQADALVSTGLREKGYNYVVIDDGCLQGQRDAEGKLQPQWAKFPNGFKPVSDYIHSLDMKFGMYNATGTQTCAGFAGSYNHEYTDAQTFADWGTDYLKYDFCHNPLITLPLEPIANVKDGQSFTTNTMSSFAKEAPPVSKIVIKKIRDNATEVIKTVEINAENTAVSGGAHIQDKWGVCLGMLDSSDTFKKAGTGTLTFQMDASEMEDHVKYAIDVYCINPDKTRWLSMQVNPETEKYSKFYLKSAPTTAWNTNAAAARTIYNVPLHAGENTMQFYLDKSDVKDAYQQDAIRCYQTMEKALDATGREIIYNLCEWGWNKPYEGWAKELGHFWRTTIDITPYAGSVPWSGTRNCVMMIYEHNVTLDEYAGPYGYNDADMLAVGLKGLNMEQNKSHFSTWCMMASPLILGTDLTTASQEILDIIGNEDLIAIDQDDLCLQAKRFKQVSDTDYLIKPLADGSVALCVFNKDSVAHDASISMSEIAAAASAKVTAKGSEHLTAAQKALFTSAFVGASSYSSEELWSGETAEFAADATISANIPGYGVKVYKLAPASASTEVTVNVTPKTANVEQGARIQLQANVQNAGHNDSVAWTVEGATHAGADATRICPLGWLTIAADEPAGTVLTIKAVSDEDPTKFDTATVTVVAATKPSVTAIPVVESIQVQPGTSAEDLSLPDTIPVQLVQNGATSTSNIPVTWDLSGYKPEAGSYTLSGSLNLGDAYYNPANLKASIQVNVEDTEVTEHALTVLFNAGSAELSIDGQDTTFANIVGQYFADVAGGKPVTLHFTPRYDREFAKILVDGEPVEVQDVAAFDSTFDMPNHDLKTQYAFTTVNKLLLRDTIAVAEDALDGEEYAKLNKDVKEKFDRALASAQNVNKTVAITQQEIDHAWLELLHILQYLEFEEGDTTKLENLLSIASDLQADLYTPSTWKPVEEAIAAANALLEQGGASQDALDETYNTLYQAILALKYKADTMQLDEIVAQAAEIAKILDTDYLDTGKDAFLAAYANAQKIQKDINATQEDVDKASMALSNAIANLRLIPNKDALAALIADAQNLDLNKYDAQSVKLLRSALQDALDTFHSDTADQAEVDSRFDALESVMTNMKEKENDTHHSSGGGSSKPSKPSTTGEGTAAVSNIVVPAAPAQPFVRSDTTLPFTVKRGSAYCFKMTVVNGENLIPSFTVGNGSVLKTQFVTRIGNDFYFRVWAIGTPGQSTGVYTQLPGGALQNHCIVTIG